MNEYVARTARVPKRKRLHTAVWFASLTHTFAFVILNSSVLDLQFMWITYQNKLEIDLKNKSHCSCHFFVMNQHQWIYWISNHNYHTDKLLKALKTYDTIQLVQNIWILQTFWANRCLSCLQMCNCDDALRKVSKCEKWNCYRVTHTIFFVIKAPGNDKPAKNGDIEYMSWTHDTRQNDSNP